MLTIYHAKVEDLSRDEACDLAGGPNPDRAAIVARHLEAGHYEAVAELDRADDMAGLEAAWAMTNNHDGNPSWSREPPRGLRPIGPTTFTYEGRVYGRRSSMIGDVIECRDGDRVVSRHAVDWIGFIAIPLTVKVAA